MSEEQPTVSSRKRQSTPPPESPSRKVRRKSVGQEGKRRSSFVRGRISRQIQAPTNSDYCWEIPTDISEDKRLARLIKTCAEYTLQKIKTDVPDLENFDTFLIQYKDKMEQTVCDMASQGLLEHACFKERYLPNPVNIEIEQSAKQYEEYIAKLEKESKAWEELVSSKETDVKEAARRAVNLDSETIDEVKLTREHTKLLTTKDNFRKLVEDVRKIEQKTELQIDALNQTATLLNTFAAAAGDRLSEKVNLMGVKSFEGIEDFSSPRTLIKNIISADSSQEMEATSSQETQT